MAQLTINTTTIRQLYDKISELVDAHDIITYTTEQLIEDLKQNVDRTLVAKLFRLKVQAYKMQGLPQEQISEVLEAAFKKVVGSIIGSARNEDQEFIILSRST